MRTGCCSVQQALSAEAATVVKQAVSLARRRGHAQVTPLHVASAMLSVAGVLRAACLQSHSHPLQCKALELCFNVALNRLPTCPPAAAMFHHGHHAPALSNALVAAFKRAQAYQRRGSVESQQQLVLAVRVELEQLIVSILDDPSVSRVMREAGFSSAQVKANVEKAMSLDQANTPISTTCPNSNHAKTKESKAKADDAVRVLDVMAAGRKRCVVVVGECAAIAEGVVRVVMDKVSKAELQQQHECLKNLQFVPLSMASFQHMSREEVDTKARELRALVRGGCAAGKGVVLVLEDLGYAAETWAAASERRRAGFHGAHGHYCPVEHMVMEVSSLVCSGGAGASAGCSGQERFWLLGFGTYPVYMKCRAAQPSLEAVWGLHPIVVPDGDLALSVNSDSEAQATQARTRTGWSLFGAAAGESELTFCDEAATAATPSLPSWLQRYQDPDYTRSASYSTSQLQGVCNKWNSKCNASAQGSSPYHTSELTLNFSSPATSMGATSSISTYTHCYNNLSSRPWYLSFEPRQPWPDHRHEDTMTETHEFVHASPESNSVSNSSDGNTEAAHHRPKFMELTAANLKILCDALERCVTRHKDMVPDISSVVLQCRSGMGRRSRMRREKPSSETWLLFQGRDRDGKEAIARALARLVFGSCTEFTCIALSEFSPVHSDSSTSDLTLKRQRSQDNVQGHIERLYEAIRENPHRVIMIDGIEELEYDWEIGIKNAIDSGRVKGCNSDEVDLEDAIVVLSCESFNSRSRGCSPQVKQRVSSNDGEEEVRRRFSLDLNACAEDVQGKEDRLLIDARILNIVDGVFPFRLTENI